jgi:hypothetical protein
MSRRGLCTAGCDRGRQPRNATSTISITSRRAPSELIEFRSIQSQVIKNALTISSANSSRALELWAQFPYHSCQCGPSHSLDFSGPRGALTQEDREPNG